MKATTTAIDLAKSAKETMLRVNEAMATATKRLAELDSGSKIDKRVNAAISQIHDAMKFAEVTARSVKVMASCALALQGHAVVELTDYEVAALSYGLLADDKP